MTKAELAKQFAHRLYVGKYLARNSKDYDEVISAVKAGQVTYCPFPARNTDIYSCTLCLDVFDVSVAEDSLSCGCSLIKYGQLSKERALRFLYMVRAELLRLEEMEGGPR